MDTSHPSINYKHVDRDHLVLLKGMTADTIACFLHENASMKAAVEMLLELEATTDGGTVSPTALLTGGSGGSASAAYMAGGSGGGGKSTAAARLVKRIAIDPMSPMERAELDAIFKGSREFGHIDEFRAALVDKVIADVRLSARGDEGLVLDFRDGSSLEFFFSGDEGEILIRPEGA